MTIQELREKRAKAWDDAREFLDSKRNDSGLLSEEDSKTYDAMEQQIVAYGKEIDRLERQEKLAREMNAATSVPLVSVPGTHTEQSEKTGIASDSYNKAFWNNIRNRNYGFFGIHHRTYNEFDAQQEGHKYRETTHCCRRQKTCCIASDYRKNKYTCHHNQSVFDVQIFIFMISIS